MYGQHRDIDVTCGITNNYLNSDTRKPCAVNLIIDDTKLLIYHWKAQTILMASFTYIAILDLPPN